MRTITEEEIFEFIETGFEYVYDLDEAKFFEAQVTSKSGQNPRKLLGFANFAFE